MLQRVYLDSCIAIYIVEAIAPFKDIIESMLLEPGLMAYASALVRTECLVGAFKQQSSSLEESYEAFLGTVVLAPIGEEVWVRAAKLRANSGMLLPDALHVAIAEHAGCAEFWTSDLGLKRVMSETSLSIRIIEADQDSFRST